MPDTRYRLLGREEAACQVVKEIRGDIRDCREPAAVEVFYLGVGICMCYWCYMQGREPGEPSLDELRRDAKYADAQED